YTPYKDAINAGDVTFFFEKNYEEDLGNFENANEVLKFIDSFREPIRMMSDTNKAHSMQYIQILSKLSEVYVSI
ncbi:hypothetical protein EBQ91_00260, partial [bacterium]|nr:hypothetical protein [bacterium]